MTNPHNNARAAPKGPATEKAKIRSSIQKMSKLIDRSRKSFSRVKAKMPDAPAVLRAEQFMRQHGMTSLAQTKWIKTASQLKEYEQFLKQYDKYKTRTVPGAKAAQRKQLNNLEDIMLSYGWSPDVYSVEDFYKQLNKLDLYRIMSDFHVSSDEVVSEATIIMNTSKGKQVDAYTLLTKIFGAPVATKQKAAQYKKGTKAHTNARKRRDRR